MQSQRTSILPGTRYGRLIVIEDAAPYRTPSGKASRQLRLHCDCGDECVIQLRDLRRGHTQSCGCLHRERLASRNRTHNLTGTPEYRSWANMLTRCQNPKAKDWMLYGGRGITVCPEWQSFGGFYADMGPKPLPGLTLDRIDSNLGYLPGNCRWASPREQARNISTNRMLTHDGLTLCMAEWGERTGIPGQAISHRLNLGWSVEQALTTPLHGSTKHHRLLTYGGETLSVTAWSKRVGIANSTLEKRLEAGWSVERAVTTPLRHRKSEPGTVSSSELTGPHKP